MNSSSPSSTPQARGPRLAILSYSSGEYDARSFRLARSAIEAGYEVTIYTRWHTGLAPVEEHDGYRIVRADPDWRLAVPFRRDHARRVSAARVASTAATQPRTGAGTTVGAGNATGAAGGVPAASGGAPRTGDATVRGRLSRARRSPLGRVLLVPAKVARRAARGVLQWFRLPLMFPLRPMGWAVALEDVVEPADIWHGMWAGSLPALVRLSRRHGGGTIYDSRDVYMLSRDFAHMGWPMRPILAGAERRWARRVDRVLTVNEPYADLIVQQLGVARPPVVRNCPERWTPPVPAPDLIREATGISAGTFIALYQGQLTTDRGIEQAMGAVLHTPNTVLVLLGFGSMGPVYRKRSQEAPYAGKVFVLPAVPPSGLLEWSASADVMLMPIQPTTTNHTFTTPQKLWEAIAAGVPVVAADLPGMAAVVEPEQIGVLVDPTSQGSIAEGMRRILQRSAEERQALRSHVLGVAHARYNWESQLDTLFALYADLGCPPVRDTVNRGAGAQGSPAGDGAVGAAATLTGPTLHLVGSRPSPAGDGDTTVVLADTTAIPTAAERASGVVLLRDVLEDVMRELDVYAAASEALDTWTEATGIAELLAHKGVSFWYGVRLRHWTWVVQRLLWLAVVDRLVAMHAPTRSFRLEPGLDPDLVAAVRGIAARDGIAVVVDGGAPGAFFARIGPGGARSDAGASSAAARGASATQPGHVAMSQAERHKVVRSRLAAIKADPANRLLVVQAHRRQHVETPAGPRSLNVYLGPVIDRLRGSHLDPFEIDIRSSMTDDREWALIAGSDAHRVLPSDVVGMLGGSGVHLETRQETMEAVRRIDALSVPLIVRGVDLGPELVRNIADRTETTHARRLDDVARIQHVLRTLHPAGILIADEYHRQDWLAAARLEGIPIAAIQHGVIYRWHTGYMHRTRPPELRLPDRTYTYGRWERDLLVNTSVYRPDEVVVGGSPRLDLVMPEASDRDAVRRELGVAEGDRMLVLSGTWGPLYRSIHYPIALARLFAAPLERVHLVVKLHPSEQDEGPYREIIEGLAAAGGFAPPPITVVRDVDLYRLLRAADAHLGIHSTVLTEAVAAGTPNLLAMGLAAADLLGYVDAGVAIPVETPAQLVAALDIPRDQALDPARREAFLAAHFEPGNASTRIADDLLAWLG